jgi:hypothetical protein
VPDKKHAGMTARRTIEKECRDEVRRTIEKARRDDGPAHFIMFMQDSIIQPMRLTAEARRETLREAVFL